MVIFISGSINSGKTTLAQKLGAVFIDIDDVNDRIPGFDLSKDIAKGIALALEDINKLTDAGKSVVASYPIRKEDHRQITKGLRNKKPHFITLAPRLEIAQSRRGNRVLSDWEVARIKYHYETGIASPSFGKTVDNSELSVKETVAVIERLVGAKQSFYLRVFTNPDGDYGDATSIVIDEGRHISDKKRQAIARTLNTGETVFVNDIATADISFVHPQGEIGFAGVGAVGAAWLLAKLRGKLNRLQGRDGKIVTRQQDPLMWVRAELSTMPPWSFKQLKEAKTVEQIELGHTADWQHTVAWAWIDETRGLIRARTFAADWDIPEAQGNGSGSMLLAAKLGRAIEIKHGEGAVIFAKPSTTGWADIGGRVKMEEQWTI